MHGRIELIGAYYEVAVHGRYPDQRIQIGDDPPRAARLEVKQSGDCEIEVGELKARVRMHFKGETGFIRAFGQTFTLRVVNPVEQARMATGGTSRRAKAPMPGVVVEIHVAENQPLLKGQLIMTIESMKILTAIPAPSDGIVEKVHFAAGQSFEKGAVLVTLRPEGN
jgi:biotin carboxyl carrier protein